MALPCSFALICSYCSLCAIILINLPFAKRYMAVQEEKTLLKLHERPINISQLLEFSPNKLSETEYLVMATLTNSKFAMNTYQIYRAIAEKILTEKLNIKMINQTIRKMSKTIEGARTVLEFRKMWADPKTFEGITSAVREIFTIDIPSYRRILRTLENLNELGWVMKRETSTKKEGAFWFISDEIRKKLQS